MVDVECESCPIRHCCNGYKKANHDNELSYHPQKVVRACDWDCPLVKLITEEVNDVGDKG